MLSSKGEDFRAFWTERHLCTLTTIRPDGTPHVVPVGVTLDVETATARVITSAALTVSTPHRIASMLLRISAALTSPASLSRSAAS